jgi:aminopeptidase-like protein
MKVSDLKQEINCVALGREMYHLVEQLYPICRSITGEGFRDTLRQIQTIIPLEFREIPTGTQVFDWRIPKEWNINDAFIRNSQGEKIVDFKKLNLHVLNYSIPINERMSLGRLKEHLFTLPQYPDWVPYRTSYYTESWGFCLSHCQFLSLEDNEYEVCIDSSLEDGHLTYGEYFIQGRSSDEVLVSCHACHPSLCNDNLSGIALVTFLSKSLASLDLRFSYRFLLIPGTIGSIAWLSRNEEKVPRVKHGLVVACVGDPGKLTYKRSRQGDAEIDRAAVHVLKHSGQPFEILDFSPYGYDERQYCSPGFNLAVGSLTRTPHNRYPEYHTSADNLDLVKPEYLGDSLDKYLSVVSILENNVKFVNKMPKCEPQLGKRGLYQNVGGGADREKDVMAVLWVLNLSDGKNTLLDIAERSELSFDLIHDAAIRLLDQDLLEAYRGMSPSGE